VYPSMKEGWGLTNIEANACGTAVLAANSPGLRDSVVDGKTGFLYNYGNISEMAERMKQILSDESLRVRLECGGREWAKRFNWDDAAELFLQVVNDVVRQEKSQ
ncbi:MAG: glycosyltransferase, partial [bacterium]